MALGGVGLVKVMIPQKHVDDDDDDDDVDALWCTMTHEGKLFFVNINDKS